MKDFIGKHEGRNPKPEGIRPWEPRPQPPSATSVAPAQRSVLDWSEPSSFRIDPVSFGYRISAFVLPSR